MPNPASGDPEDLAGAEREGHVVEPAGPAEVLDLEQLRGVGGDVVDQPGLAHVAAGHRLRHGAPGVARRVARLDHAAVAQDGQPLGDGEHLVELVADEHDRDAALLQPAHDDEEPLDLAVGQRRRRLVHDEDLRVVDERAADRDELAVGDGQPLHLGVEVEGQSQVVDDALGGGADARPRREDAALGELAQHRDVLGGGEVREEGEVLVDHLDAAADGLVGGEVPVRRADDLDEGRLAAAVLTGEAVHLARRERQGDPVQRVHTAVRLDDVADLEDWCGSHGHGFHLHPLAPPPPGWAGHEARPTQEANGSAGQKS